MKLAERLLNAVHNTLVVELAGLGVIGADIGRIMRDFANGRKHIWFTLVVKASFWQQLLWHFFGIAHNTLHLARACATRCLQLKENILPGDPIHWLTEMLLFTERGFRELVAFAQGGPMETLHFLIRFAGTLKH